MSNKVRCQSCRRLTERPYGASCAECEQEVEENLIELGGDHGLYATVIGLGASALYPVAGGRTDRAPTKVEAPLPINTSVVDLTSSSGGVVTTLRGWVGQWHAHRNFTVPAWPIRVLSMGTADGLIRGQLDIAIDALLASLTWAAEYRPDFWEFRRDVDRMTTGCRRLIDPTNPDTKPTPRIPLGRCPGPEDSDVGCGQRLEIKLGSTSIRCPACATVWPKRRWPALAALVRR